MLGNENTFISYVQWNVSTFEQINVDKNNYCDVVKQQIRWKMQKQKRRLAWKLKKINLTTQQVLWFIELIKLFSKFCFYFESNVNILCNSTFTLFTNSNSLLAFCIQKFPQNRQKLFESFYVCIRLYVFLILVPQHYPQGTIHNLPISLRSLCLSDLPLLYRKNIASNGEKSKISSMQMPLPGDWKIGSLLRDQMSGDCI